MDWLLFLVTIILVSFGIIMVYNASFPYAIEEFGDKAYFFKRQATWAFLGLAVLFTAKQFPYWKWRPMAKAGLIISIGLLIAVHFVGESSQGAERWIGVGPIRFQPSEFAKISLALFMASALADRPKRVKDFWGGVFPLLLIAGAVIFLTERQPDLGTAITMLAAVFVTLYLAGTKGRWLLTVAAIVSMLTLGAILHQGFDGYRWKRVTTFVNPQNDPMGDGYQIIHSGIALGTGGVTGVGFGESREKRTGNLPAPSTDYIFAIIGEEFGLVGTGTILALFALLTARGLQISYRARDRFGSLLAAGIACTIGMQAALNIAVVTASIPATGIPLPFISYGGSSLISLLFAIGVLLNISQNPDYVSRQKRSSSGNTEDTPRERELSRHEISDRTRNLIDSQIREEAHR